MFTDPRRGPVRCPGFELRAGQKHNGKTIWTGQYFDKGRAMANAERQREHSTSPEIREFFKRAIEETQAKTGGWSFGPRWSWSRIPGRLQKLEHAVELGQARVMDFAGAPDEQMRAGGRFCGRCCICGKALTDPHSIELGIGPECRHELHLTARQAPGPWIIGGSNEASEVPK